MKIVFQGDSITDVGRNLSNGSLEMIGQGYACMITGDLGAHHPGRFTTINRGISGNRIVDVYARIKKDIWNLQPDLLSILIGVNDVWHDIDEDGLGNGVDAERFERVYDMLIGETKARFPNAKMMILEPFVLPGSATEKNWAIFRKEVPLRAAAAKRISDKYHCTFVPLQGMFDAACRMAPAAYWLGDGVHPTSAGHRLIADEWEKAFYSEICPEPEK